MRCNRKKRDLDLVIKNPINGQNDTSKIIKPSKSLEKRDLGKRNDKSINLSKLQELNQVILFKKFQRTLD